MIGIVKRYKALRMLGGTKYLCGVGDIYRQVDWTMKYQ